MPEALMVSTTSPGPGVGSGNSRISSLRSPRKTTPCMTFLLESTGLLKKSQDAQKGPDARRRPKAAGEAHFLYVEPAAEGADEADGPFSASCVLLAAEARAGARQRHADIVGRWLPRARVD